MKTETSQEIMEQIKTYVLLATKRMLTIDEVCLLTGYKKQCMYRLTSNREIPYYKPSHNKLYFDRNEVEAWMRRGRVEVGSKKPRKTTKKQPQA